jgi:citrate synthase
MFTNQHWITAAEASQVLQVSRATLYAYVSRGYVRSQAKPGASHERLYAREDVERLRRRTEERRDPDKAAAHALQWGMPILESSIALIDGHRLYYRGHDAVTLSRSRSLEEAASLIWCGRFDVNLSPDSFPGQLEPAAAAAAAARAPSGDLPFVARAQIALARESARDPLALDLRPTNVAFTGWRILQLLTRTATESVRRSANASPMTAARARASTAAAVARPRIAAAPATIDQTLARAWGASARGDDLLRNALILCADHELNVSSFTARCVASAGSNPYAVAIAGLAALEGNKHGGASARAESMLDSMRRARDVRSALAERLRRGETMNGFGHPLYPDGDPRAAALIELLRERYAKSPELAFVSNVANAAASALRERPNLDFGLAALARVLRLPAGSPLTLFAIGRTIGWIGHAIEQYATGQLIRPRAKYVGPVPGQS